VPTGATFGVDVSDRVRDLGEEVQKRGGLDQANLEDHSGKKPDRGLEGLKVWEGRG